MRTTNSFKHNVESPIVTPPQQPIQRPPRRFSGLVLVAVLLIGLLAGGLITYAVVTQRMNDLQREIDTLQKQLVQNITVYQNGTDLSALYGKVKNSVVTIQGVEASVFGNTTVQGSGFVYNYSGRMVIVTNFHVINGVENITVTFGDGNEYRAKVLGFDAYADLAVIETQKAPTSEFTPLRIARSSALKVGDPVLAVGNPFGLTGSMTTGVVSQLGRTLSESTTGGFLIANVLQISVPINPGNSGGPLLNYVGSVVGITTAIVSSSQGVGFAIPSDTILREVGSLITNGSYTKHSYLGIASYDMNYDLAQAMGVNVTYGLLISEVVKGSPAQQAGLRGNSSQVAIDGVTYAIGGDIIIALNGTRIIDGDGLSSYLDANTLPGNNITFTIIRSNSQMDVPVVLGTRPPPP